MQALRRYGGMPLHPGAQLRGTIRAFAQPGAKRGLGRKYQTKCNITILWTPWVS